MGGNSQIGMKEMIAEYDRRFGLDKPLFDPVLHLSERHRAPRVQLLDVGVSNQGHRHHLALAAVDDHAARRDDAAGLDASAPCWARC